MTLTITDYWGHHVSLEPRVELYTVHDFMGKEMPGLAIALYTRNSQNSDDLELYAVLTKSFGEFIGLRNSAYIDTNNCYFARQLLEQGIAQETGLTKQSGFCEYPLWTFREDFLKEIGGEKYQKYIDTYDTYSPFC